MTALAVRRGHDDADAQPARRALGGSERETPGVRRLLGLAGRRLGEQELEHHVAEVFIEELRDIGTFGISAGIEAVHLIKRGSRIAGAARLAEAGMATHHAIQFAHVAGTVMTGAAHTSTSATVGGVLGPVLALSLLHTKVAMAIIRQALEAGMRDAACRSYAQTWARVVTDALFGEGVSRPEHTGLAHLDEARGRAFHDAMELLRAIDGGMAGELAAQLKQELGTISTARRALTEAVLREAGMTGIALFEAPAVR